MRLLRYVCVPWTMILVYALFTAFLGQNGIYARRHLEAEKRQLLENQKALEQSYSEFLKTKDSLTYDPDALSVYARQLGYGKENEAYIRIMGLGIAINADTPAGQVLYATDPVFISDTTIKILSMLFGMAVLAFFLVSDFLSAKIIDRD